MRHSLFFIILLLIPGLLLAQETRNILLNKPMSCDSLSTHLKTSKKVANIDHQCYMILSNAQHHSSHLSGLLNTCQVTREQDTGYSVQLSQSCKTLLSNISLSPTSDSYPTNVNNQVTSD